MTKAGTGDTSATNGDNDENEAANSEGNNKRKSLREDPDCPAVVDFKWKEKENGQVQLSQLVLELSQQLFCRQWKLVSTLPLAAVGSQEVLFFCRDARILPAPESFAMLELEKPDRIRLHR